MQYIIAITREHMFITIRKLSKISYIDNAFHRAITDFTNFVNTTPMTAQKADNNEIVGANLAIVESRCRCMS